MAFIALIIFSGCAHNSVTRDSAAQLASQINTADGISDTEATYIAQNFLYSTSEEPCASELLNISLSNPHVKHGWGNSDDRGVYVGFQKKGFHPFEVFPLYVKVSVKNGNASCSGHLVLK